MYVCGYVHMSIGTLIGQRRESPGTRIQSCELPEIGAGNRTGLFEEQHRTTSGLDLEAFLAAAETSVNMSQPVVVFARMQATQQK